MMRSCNYQNKQADVPYGLRELPRFPGPLLARVAGAAVALKNRSNTSNHISLGKKESGLASVIALLFDRQYTVRLSECGV